MESRAAGTLSRDCLTGLVANSWAAWELAAELRIPYGYSRHGQEYVRWLDFVPGYRLFEANDSDYNSNSVAMIGFDIDLRNDQRQSDEEADTRRLEKKDLYEMVVMEWYLPPYQSRGVTRDYLLKVHRNRVFRISHPEIKRFEVDLTPEHQKKVQGMGHSILIRKLNLLLQLTGRNPLGFDEYDMPDQTWLHRVARVIDPTSLTEFFQVAVRPEAPPTSHSMAISCIHHGRVEAAKWFMRHQIVKSNKRFWDALHTVSTQYRALLNKDLSIEALQRDLRDQQAERAIMGNTLDDLISKASLTYAAILNPALKPEAVIAGSGDVTAEMRAELIRYSKLYAFLTQNQVHLLYRHDPRSR